MKKIIGIIIAVVLIVVLLNPGWFLPEALASETLALFTEKFPFTVDSSISVSNILVAILMLCIVYVVTAILNIIISYIAKKNKRTQTVSELLLSIIRYASVIIAIVWCLAIFGVNVAAIFASLGIVSLVIGFGAQSLIEDIITGIFIIFEGQYSIGDIIVLDDFRGTVKRIGVRTTTIEDAGRNLKVVNNSDIRNFQNRSKDTSVAVVVCDVAYETDLHYVEKVLETALPEMYEQHKDIYLSTPKFLGVDDLAASGVTLKFAVDALETNVFAAQRALRKDIKLCFDKNNIEIPFTQVVIHNGDK